MNKQTNDGMNEQMKKKGINKEMHGVCVWACARACKYDTKFYLISLPRDTTPKFIHRWFIHTISSLAFNRIPLSTRRICQLNKPNASFGLENIAHWKHARLHLLCKRGRYGERGQRGKEGEKNIDESEIPFTLHISGYFVFVIFLSQNSVVSTPNEVNTYFDCFYFLSLVSFTVFCVLKRNV